MFVRKNLPSSVKTAPVIDQTVIHCCKHIHIQFGKLQLLELHTTLISFIKINTLPFRYCISSCPLISLLFFISKMICRSNLRKVIHLFRAKLHLHIAPCTVIIKSNMKRTISVGILSLNIVPVIRAYRIIEKRRGAYLLDRARLDIRRIFGRGLRRRYGM